jgi:hypothetical protein
MATATTTRPGRKKKAIQKPKTRTLHIADLATKTCIAIDQGKQRFGTSANTKAAVSMLEDYFSKVEDLQAARDRIADLERSNQRIVSAYRGMMENQAILKEVLGDNE